MKTSKKMKKSENPSKKRKKNKQIKKKKQMGKYMKTMNFDQWAKEPEPGGGQKRPEET